MVTAFFVRRWPHSSSVPSYSAGAFVTLAPFRPFPSAARIDQLRRKGATIGRAGDAAMQRCRPTLRVATPRLAGPVEIANELFPVSLMKPGGAVRHCVNDAPVARAFGQPVYYPRIPLDCADGQSVCVVVFNEERSMTDTAQCSSFSARSNAKRAAEKMIANGNAGRW